MSLWWTDVANLVMVEKSVLRAELVLRMAVRALFLKLSTTLRSIAEFFCCLRKALISKGDWVN